MVILNYKTEGFVKSRDLKTKQAKVVFSAPVFIVETSSVGRIFKVGSSEKKTRKFNTCTCTYLYSRYF